MSTVKYAGYETETLKPFTEKLLDEYYNTLEALCSSAAIQANRVATLESDTNTSEYAAQCGRMIDDIRTHIRMRKERFIPYIHELIEKTSSKHDCTNCSGNCKLNHDMQIVELNASNKSAQKILNRLQLSTLPLYSQTMFPDEYRILRNRMALMEMNMIELFFLENTYLVPKIIEAQKIINAGRSHD